MRVRTVALGALIGTLLLSELGRAVAAQEPLALIDAVRRALVEQPAIKMEREQVVAAEGTLRTAQGRFDVQFGGLVDYARHTIPLRLQDRGDASATALTHQTRYALSADKLFRSGLTMSPSIGVTRQAVNVDPLATNRAAVSFDLTQPLMRGRGAEIVTAAERAARDEVGAAVSALRHAASVTVYRTALAYWQYVAAIRSLDIVEASEQRARRLVDETQTLIDAGNRPAADIRQVTGNLSERMALRASYQQTVFEARQALGLAIGLTADDTAALAVPGDGFPAPLEDPAALGDRALVDRAVQDRADLDAARRRERVAQTRIGAARDDLRPVVDLHVSVGYSGLVEDAPFPGLFSSLAQRVTGPNAMTSIRVARPIARHTAHGQVARAEAEHRQALLRIDDLTRTIRAGVLVAQDDLARSADRVRLLREAADLYAAAVEDERAKLQLGLSTIIDLVLIEDRLTRSLLDEVSARLRYASALARLRFETGTLVGGLTPPFEIAAHTLVTIPR